MGMAPICQSREGSWGTWGRPRSGSGVLQRRTRWLVLGVRLSGHGALSRHYEILLIRYTVPTPAPPLPAPTPPLGTGVGEISLSSFWFYSSESLETESPRTLWTCLSTQTDGSAKKGLEPALPPPGPASPPTKQKQTHRGCGGCCRHTLVYNRESKYIISLGMVLAKNLQLALFHVTWSNLCMYTQNKKDQLANSGATWHKHLLSLWNQRTKRILYFPEEIRLGFARVFSVLLSLPPGSCGLS